MTEANTVAIDHRNARISAALYDRETRSPYYIVAPRFVSTSAGIVALYRLCHLLNVAGEDAFIVIENGASIERFPAPNLRAPVLTQIEANQHFQSKRTPIILYPETSTLDLKTGVTVRYILNYVGLLGGPEHLKSADYVIAYAENLAKSLPRCDQVLYVPVSDPMFWRPDPAKPRDRRSVYTGKYEDFHHQTIPREIADGATVITRNRARSQSREELRDILQRSSVLYVFENTALATEAALCGCAVVCIANDYFTELIAAVELGTEGFTFENTPAAIASAAARVEQFTPSYLAVIEQFPVHLLKLVEETQRIASTKQMLSPARLPIPPIVGLIDSISYEVRRLAISVEEIGFVETFRRGLSGLFRRLAAGKRGERSRGQSPKHRAM